MEAHGEFVRLRNHPPRPLRRLHADRPGRVSTPSCSTRRGEVTECTRGNIAFLLDGQWVTPPLPCGMLPGVGREVLLAQGRLQEQVVRVELTAAGAGHGLYQQPAGLARRSFALILIAARAIVCER